jgi:hypothetical protein
MTSTVIESRLNDAHESRATDNCFSTRQLAKAIFWDLDEDRHGKLKAERQKVELGNRILRGELLDRVDLENIFWRISERIREVVRGSALSNAEKDDLLRSIAGVKDGINDLASQTKKNQANGESVPELNGAKEPQIKKKRGRPRKVKV